MSPPTVSLSPHGHSCPGGGRGAGDRQEQTQGDSHHQQLFLQGGFGGAGMPPGSAPSWPPARGYLLGWRVWDLSPKHPVSLPATSLLPFPSSSAAGELQGHGQVRFGVPGGGTGGWGWGHHPCASPGQRPLCSAPSPSPPQDPAGQAPSPGAQHGVQRPLQLHHQDQFQVGAGGCVCLYGGCVCQVTPLCHWSPWG